MLLAQIIALALLIFLDWWLSMIDPCMHAKNKGDKMSNRLIKILFLFNLITAAGLAHGFGDKTFFTTRSQSVNAVRDLVGTQKLVHRYPGGLNNRYCLLHDYSLLAITPEYMRSFRPDKIADFLFGARKLTFSGSRTAERGKNDILADYFGLPADFRSTVSFTPRITNFLMDFAWYQGLEHIAEGLYFHVHMPVVHTKWDLNLSEFIFERGSTFHPGGYMGPARIERDSLAANVREAFEGNTTFGDMRESLKFGKIFGRQTSTRASEIQGVVGWNFYQDDWYHVGLNVRIAAPVGNRSKAEFLFESMIGNGHHWELGGGITTHVDVWQSEDEQHTLALYFDANITHLFRATQKRSFDFTKNGPGSRYMLVEEILAPAKNLFIGNTSAAGGTLANNQYIGRLVPAINLTTLDTKIKINVQADLVLKLAYQCNGLEVDLGYNFYARSKEKLQRRSLFASNRFALKGDTQIYGFTTAPNPDIPVPLSATQNNATIKAGQGNGNVDFTNNNSDKPTRAFSVEDLLNLLGPDAQALRVNPGAIQTSNPAILLKDSDINVQSGILPRAISHKIFTHVGYAWHNNDGLVPYLGIGADAEWATPSVKKNSAFAQWGLWVKGGIAY